MHRGKAMGLVYVGVGIVGALGSYIVQAADGAVSVSRQRW